MNTHHTVADDSDREVVSFRLPKSEILRIEALAKRRAEKMPGQRVTRTDALRSLYLFALANMEEVGS